jgi:DNA-binding transcriptional MerR regulator
LTLTEAAQLLGVHPKTVRGYQDTGTLTDLYDPRVKSRLGRRVLRPEVEKLLRQRLARRACGDRRPYSL